MSRDTHDQKPDKDFTAIGEGLHQLTLSLLGGLQIVPDEEVKPPAITNQKNNRQPNAKLSAAATDVTSRPPTKEELAYIVSELVQCSFPHRDPGDIPAWIRRNGNLTLIIQPGIDPRTGKSMGIPFGEWPRVQVPYIFKELIANEKELGPEVHLGETFNKFLRAIGGDPKTGRGKRGAAKTAQEQLRRLAHCRISFHYTEGTAQKGREAFVNMEFARSGEFWWDLKNPDQTSIFENKIVIGDLLYQAIKTSRVPVDFRVLLALKTSLKQSSFAIDIYNWTRLRMWRMRKKDQVELRFRLSELQGHFGSQYKRIDHFKAALEEALINVQLVSPEFDYRFEKNVLILIDRDAPLAVPAKDPDVAARRLQRLKPYNEPSHKTRSWFVREFPKHDIEDALNEYHAMIEKEKIDVANPDALFKKFAKSYVANRPK